MPCSENMKRANVFNWHAMHATRMRKSDRRKTKAKLNREKASKIPALKWYVAMIETR